MDLKETLKELYCLRAEDIESSKTILQTIRYALHEPQHASVIIIHVNKLLSESRGGGAEILVKILPDLSDSVLEENAVQWLHRAINYQRSSMLTEKRFLLLANLLSRCTNLQVFHKILVSSLLSKLVDFCIRVHIKSEKVLYSLQCLSTCLRHCPSACIQFIKKAEAYLEQFLDIPQCSVNSEIIGTCMVLLNQVGGEGAGGITHSRNYCEYIEKLCNTLHSLCDDLLEDVSEFRVETRKLSNIYKFNRIPSHFDRRDDLKIVSARMKNICNYLITALSCEYITRKTFKPNTVVSIINRSLAVHFHVDSKHLSNIFLCIAVQDYQIRMFNVLKALIDCLKQDLAPFYSIKKLQHFLRRTSKCQCFKTNSEYTITVYQVIQKWIRILGGHVDAISQEKIIHDIIDHITHKKPLLELQAGTIKSSEPERKEDLSFQMKRSKENICYEALITLEILLLRVDLNLEENICLALFEVVVKQLLMICTNVYELPYTSQKCRLQLFKVLIALFNQQKRSLDIGMAINILSLGEQSSDSEISNCCTKGLLILEKVCQPSHISLQIKYDHDVQQEKSRTSSVADKETSHTDLKKIVVLQDISIPNTTDGNLVQEDDSSLSGTEEFDLKAQMTEENSPISTEDVICINEDNDTDECVTTIEEINKENTLTNGKNSCAKKCGKLEITSIENTSSIGLIPEVVNPIQEVNKIVDEVPAKRSKLSEDVVPGTDNDSSGALETMLASFVDTVE